MTERPAENPDERHVKEEQRTHEDVVQPADEATPAEAEEPKVEEHGPRELPLVALRETVIFPEMIVPLQVGRDKSVAALNAAVAANGPIALVTQRTAEQEEIDDPSELYEVGTLAKIAQVVQLQDGTVRAIVQGQGRLKVHGFVQNSPYIRVLVEEIKDVTPEGIEVQALMRTVQAQIEQYVANGAPVPPEAAVAARNISEPGLLADMVAYSPDLSTEQRMELLRTTDVLERLKLVSNFLGRQIEILELKGKIQSEVKSEMDKTQREYILREQLKAIQRELGEDDPQQAEINELRDKVEAAGMPEEVKARALKEVERMSRIPSASPEVGVIRTYVDWLIALPWNVSTTDNLDIKIAAKILEEDHYGLEKIKERILEYLAVQEPRGNTPQPDPLVRRTSGRRQDVPGQVDRASDGPQVRPDEPRRYPRRSGDPRPPPDVHRRAARSNRPEPQDGRFEQPGLHAGRSGQDRHGLPRGSILGSPRGPRSGAEQHLPGQLPRGAVRSDQGALHHHGQSPRSDSGASSRPHGGHPAAGLHRAGKDRDRQAVPHPQADEEPRPVGPEHPDHR